MSASFVSELAMNGVQLSLGLVETVVVAAVSTVFGTVLGIPIGLGLFRGGRTLRLLLAFYVDVVRGTPVLVLILASYYITPALGFNVSAFWAGIIAFSIFCGAQTAEITRGSLAAIDRGQSEAAMTIGLRQYQILSDILIPQAIRIGWPAWTAIVIETVKGSSLLLLIGVAELMLTTQQIMARTHMIMQFLAMAGILYFLVNFSLERLSALVERRFQFERHHA